MRNVVFVLLVCALGFGAVFAYRKYSDKKTADYPENESGKKMAPQRFDVGPKYKEETGQDLAQRFDAQRDLKRNVATLGLYSVVNKNNGSARKTINQKCKQSCGCGKKGACVGNKKRKCVRDCKEKIKTSA